MRKVLNGLLALVILVGSSQAALAWPGPGPGGPGGPEGILSMVLSLDLTEAQKHDVAVILKKYQAKFDSGAQAAHEAMRGVGDVMRKDPGNEAQVREACRKAAASFEEMAVLGGKLVTEVKAVLTPAQLKQLDDNAPPPPEPRKHRVPPFRILVDEWINAHAGAGK